MLTDVSAEAACPPLNSPLLTPRLLPSQGANVRFCRDMRAESAVSENEPVADNFKCKATGAGTSSVMTMNCTLDPLVPFGASGDGSASDADSVPG